MYFTPLNAAVNTDGRNRKYKAGFRHAGRKRSVFSSLPVMWIDLNFSCYFSAFSIASCAAFLIPVELNVAPLIVSTSADCASIIFGMIASAFDRYTLSSPSADVMARSVILPPLRLLQLQWCRRSRQPHHHTCRPHTALLLLLLHLRYCIRRVDAAAAPADFPSEAGSSQALPRAARSDPLCLFYRVRYCSRSEQQQ